MNRKQRRADAKVKEASEKVFLKTLKSFRPAILAGQLPDQAAPGLLILIDNEAMRRAGYSENPGIAGIVAADLVRNLADWYRDVIGVDRDAAMTEIVRVLFEELRKPTSEIDHPRVS